MPSAFRDLEVNEQFDFQQAFWRFQRVAWVLLALVVLAALAGLFGFGPLSRAMVTTADNLVEVRFERFGRYQTPQSIEFRFLSDQESPTVWLSSEIIDAAAVTGVVPEPDGSQIGEAGVTYRFSASSLPEGAARPPVRFELTPRRPGLVRGSLGATQEDASPIWQFVYP